MNAITGNFGTTIFDKLTTTTVLAAPNSGTPSGDTTVQGQLASSATPEPKTFVLLGGGLLAMSLMGKKKLFPAQISK